MLEAVNVDGAVVMEIDWPDELEINCEVTEGIESGATEETGETVMGGPGIPNGSVACEASTLVYPLTVAL